MGGLKVAALGLLGLALSLSPVTAQQDVNNTSVNNTFAHYMLELDIVNPITKLAILRDVYDDLGWEDPRLQEQLKDIHLISGLEGVDYELSNGNIYVGEDGTYILSSHDAADVVRAAYHQIFRAKLNKQIYSSFGAPFTYKGETGNLRFYSDDGFRLIGVFDEKIYLDFTGWENTFVEALTIHYMQENLIIDYEPNKYSQNASEIVKDLPIETLAWALATQDIYAFFSVVGEQMLDIHNSTKFERGFEVFSEYMPEPVEINDPKSLCSYGTDFCFISLTRTNSFLLPFPHDYYTTVASMSPEEISAEVDSLVSQQGEIDPALIIMDVYNQMIQTAGVSIDIESIINSSYLIPKSYVSGVCQIMDTQISRIQGCFKDGASYSGEFTWFETFKVIVHEFFHAAMMPVNPIDLYLDYELDGVSGKLNIEYAEGCHFEARFEGRYLNFQMWEEIFTEMYTLHYLRMKGLDSEFFNNYPEVRDYVMPLMEGLFAIDVNPMELLPLKAESDIEGIFEHVGRAYADKNNLTSTDYVQMGFDYLVSIMPGPD